MIVNSIHIKNFVIFKDVKLSLTDVGLAVVTGRFVGDAKRNNGIGKTALLESIRYGLYGLTRSKHKNGIVRAGTKGCSVKLDITASYKRLVIERSCTSGGMSSANISIDGKPAGTGIKTVNDVVREHLGISPELFDLIYFFRQSDQFSFVQASPADRKSVLANVFSIKYLSDCLALAKQRKSDCQAKANKLEAAIAVASQQLTTTQEQLLEQLYEYGDEYAHSTVLESIVNDITSNVRQCEIDFTADYSNFVTDVESKTDEVSNLLRKADGLSSTIQSNESRIRALEGQLAIAKAAYEKATSDLEAVASLPDVAVELRTATQHSNGLVATIARAKADLAKCIEAIRSGKEQAGTRCPTCGQVVSVEHIEQVISDYNQQAATHQNEINRASAELKQFNEKVELLTAQNNKLQTRPILQRSFDSTKANYLTKVSQIKDLQSDNERASLERNDLYEKHRQLSLMLQDLNIGQLSQRLLAIRSGLSFVVSLPNAGLSFTASGIIEQKIKQTQSEIELNKKLSRQVEDDRQSLAKLVDDMVVYDHLIDVFGKNGIQALIIENAIGVVEQFANDILVQMQSRFGVKFKTLRENKSGTVTETLDIVIDDNGQERLFESYSGGEQTIVNLAIRLALSKIISSLHGVRVESLYLDEVLAALDEFNRQEAIKVIAYLSKSFKQVFIISHTNEVRDYIESTIHIQRHDKYSEVTVATVN